MKVSKPLIITLAAVCVLALIVYGMIFFSEESGNEPDKLVIVDDMYYGSDDDKTLDSNSGAKPNRPDSDSGYTPDIYPDYNDAYVDNATTYPQEIPNAPTHVHAWLDATCTEPQVCSICYARQGSALGHSWSEATCTEPATCYRCDSTSGSALGHDYIDATCTSPEHCSVCDYSYGTTISHNYVNGTCTMCGGYDSSVPRFSFVSVPVTIDGCRITDATAYSSGSTLYVTVSGVRNSGSSDARILLQVFSSDYSEYTGSALVYIRDVSAGESFTETFVVENVIWPEHNSYDIWLN